MQPKTNNNAPPTPQDGTATIGNSAGGDTGQNAVNFPNGLSEIKIIDWARQRKSAYVGWVAPYMKRIEDNVRQFRNKAGQADGKGFPIPICASIIESVDARMQAQILNKPKIVEATCLMDEPDNDNRTIVEDFVNQTVLEIARRPDKGKATIKNGLVTGTMFWKHVWRQEPVKSITPNYAPVVGYMVNPMQPEPPKQFTGDTIEDHVKEYWDFEPKALENLCFDANCLTRINDSRFVMEKSFMSYNQLLRWQQNGMISGVERLQNVIPTGGSQQSRVEFDKQVKEANGDVNWPVFYPDEKAYLVEEWWAEMTWKNGEQVEMGDFKFFIVESKFVIGFEKNPLVPVRHPYASCPVVVDPNCLLGLSVLDAVSGIQKQINNFAGHQSELVERASKPLILYDASSGITGRTQFTKMHGLQPVNNVNGLKEMGIDMAPIEIVGKYMEQIIGIAREASGANEQFQGIEGADTATEFNGLQAAAGSRFANLSDNIQQGFLENLAAECFLFCKQFGVDGQMFVRSFTDGLSKSLTRENFAGDYDFIPAGGMTEQAKGAQIQKAMEALGMMGKMPPPADGKVFNTEKAFKEIILPNLGLKTGADWFVSPPMPMQAPGMPGAGQGGVTPLPPMPVGPQAPGPNPPLMGA